MTSNEHHVTITETDLIIDGIELLSAAMTTQVIQSGSSIAGAIYTGSYFVPGIGHGKQSRISC